MTRYTTWYRVTLRWSSTGEFPTKPEPRDIQAANRADAIRCALDSSEHAGEVVALHVKKLRAATDEETRDFISDLALMAVDEPPVRAELIRQCIARIERA